MDSQEFKFKKITEDDITYYIIPYGTTLYHGSCNISSPGQIIKGKHIYLSLTEEYAKTYALECKTGTPGHILKWHLPETKEKKEDFKLVAIDKPNQKLYDDAPENIKVILDENYGFNIEGEQKRFSVPEKDHELSDYLCEKGYGGYAANKMLGQPLQSDLDPEIVLCDIDMLNGYTTQVIEVVSAPKVPDKKKPETNRFGFSNYSPPNSAIKTSTFVTPVKGLDNNDFSDSFGVNNLNFNTPVKGAGKKNIQNVYKNKTMKRPVRAEDGTYTIKGKKYKELFGSREQVHNKTAYKTKAGLTIDDILMNKNGRLVSAKKHKTAKKEMRLEKYGYSAKKGKFGYVKIGKKTRKNKKEKKE